MKKKIIYSLTIILLIIVIIFSYKKFFKNEKKNGNLAINKDESLSENPNNLIKNLKYNVKFENNSSYTITALESELIYENQTEIVLMKNVEAIFINANNETLKIVSKNAKYNNFSYNTEFENDIRIDYLENSITSDKLFLDFKKNIVTISDNIVYEGQQGFVKADNIKIDLMTKNVEISMNKLQKKIEIISK